MRKYNPKFNPTYFPEILKRQYRRNMIRRAVKILRKGHFDRTFDAIAITGISGALFGIPLAYALGKELMIVRKKELRHSGRLEGGGYVLGVINARHYLIVDDLTESGATLKRITKAVKKVSPFAGCVGVLFSGRLSEGVLDFKFALK